MGVTALPWPWAGPAFSRPYTTREQCARIGDVQAELGMPPWVCDGMRGPDTREACRTHPGRGRLAAWITSVLTGACAHNHAVSVGTSDGVGAPELVAWLYPGCDMQLPATWNCLLPG